MDDHAIRAAGSITIDDFNEAIGTSLPQDGPRTLAGLDGLRITRLVVTPPT